MTDTLSERLRRRWERTPLRVRLVTSVLVLVTGALVLTSVANVKSLEEYLTNRVDEDLGDRFGSYGEREIRSIFAQGPGVSDYAFFLRESDGHLTSWTTANVEQLPKLTPELLRQHSGEPFTEESVDGTIRWRILSRVTDDGFGNGEVITALATPMSQVETTVARLIWIDLLVGAGVLAGLTAIGVALVRASLSPLKEIELTAAAIAAGDLSKRAPRRDTRTEVGRLGEAFNTMLGRIESALAARAASEVRALASEDRMRRFVADASHELRTPLTTVRGFAELYRHRGDVAPDEAATIMRRIEDEATRMGLLVEDLLLLARLDQERPVADRQVDLLSVAVDTVTATLVTAADHHIDLRTEGGPFLVRGDDLRLRQVLSNLIGNAVQHTPAGTTIQVTLRRQGCDVAMVVADNGPGMTSEQTERVFERFYRADKARSRAAGGTGLGLAIVSALVAAHNGTVEVSAEPGHGAVFTVTLALDPDVLVEDGADEEDDEDDRDETPA